MTVKIDTIDNKKIDMQPSYFVLQQLHQILDSNREHVLINLFLGLLRFV